MKNKHSFHEVFTYAEKGVIIALSTISSTLSDGLDPRELLSRRGGGRVTADRLPSRVADPGIGYPGTDSGLLRGIAVLPTAVSLLFVCVL